MPDFIPLSKSKHAGWGWLPSNNYQFAAQDATVPLVVDEIGSAMLTLPLTFRYGSAQPAGEPYYELAALLSPLPKQNLFVTPDGRWLDGYIPAYLQAYPFRMLMAKGTAQRIVCFDQASGLMAEPGTPDSKPFFAETGDPSPALGAIVELLERHEVRRLQTQAAVDCLAQLGLIVPWKLSITGVDKKKHWAQGLFKVDAQALQKIDAASLHTLHQRGALPIVYAQLLSEQHAKKFAEQLRARSGSAQKQTEKVTMGNIKSLFSGKSHLLNIDGS